MVKYWDLRPQGWGLDWGVQWNHTNVDILVLQESSCRVKWQSWHERTVQHGKSGLRAKGQLPRPILAYIQRRQKLLFCKNFFFLFPPNHQTFLILFVQFVRNKGVVMIFFLQYMPVLLMKVQVFFCFKIWDEEKEKVRGAKFSDN